MSKTEKRATEVIEQAVTGELDSDKEPEAIETLNKFGLESTLGCHIFSILACAAVGSEAGSCGLSSRLRHLVKSVDEAIQSVNSQLVQIVSLKKQLAILGADGTA